MRTNSAQRPARALRVVSKTHARPTFSPGLRTFVFRCSIGCCRALVCCPCRCRCIDAGTPFGQQSPACWGRGRTWRCEHSVQRSGCFRSECIDSFRSMRGCPRVWCGVFRFCPHPNLEAVVPDHYYYQRARPAQAAPMPEATESVYFCARRPLRIWFPLAHLAARFLALLPKCAVDVLNLQTRPAPRGLARSHLGSLCLSRLGLCMWRMRDRCVRWLEPAGD